MDGTCDGNLSSEGFNLVNGCTFATPDPTDAVGDALLGPLADNGGGTHTHLPQPGSSAIDLIPRAQCTVDSDQRGVARPVGAACDAGSVEAS